MARPYSVGSFYTIAVEEGLGTKINVQNSSYHLKPPFDGSLIVTLVRYGFLPLVIDPNPGRGDYRVILYLDRDYYDESLRSTQEKSYMLRNTRMRDIPLLHSPGARGGAKPKTIVYSFHPLNPIDHALLGINGLDINPCSFKRYPRTEGVYYTYNPSQRVYSGQSVSGRDLCISNLLLQGFPPLTRYNPTTPLEEVEPDMYFNFYLSGQNLSPQTDQYEFIKSYLEILHQRKDRQGNLFRRILGLRP